MPLTLSHWGQQATVREVRGKDESRKFLANLGFVPGAAVMVVSELSGNLIVSVKDTRVALSKSMANRIFVELS